MARRVQVEGSRARGSSTAREPARPIGAGRARLPPLEAALESNGEWHGGRGSICPNRRLELEPRMTLSGNAARQSIASGPSSEPVSATKTTCLSSQCKRTHCSDGNGVN
ncbi:MAG TPA: hypothetical protein VE820_10250 [Sphingomicrobium sp.]|nr:hypothetical protein [Sphingomicrobium sp.]